MATDLAKALCDAVTRLDAQYIPNQLLPVGTRLLRGVPSQFYWTGGKATPDLRDLSPTAIDTARSPYWLAKSDYRWSGTLPSLGAGQSGLYVSLDSGANAAEATHYAEKAGPLPKDPATRLGDVATLFGTGGATTLFRYETTQPLLLVDLSDRGGAANKFYNRLVEVPAVRDALGVGPGNPATAKVLRAKVYDSVDYTAARAIGIALGRRRGPSYDGLLARTARAVRSRGDDGVNACLFGKENEAVGGLRFDCVLQFTPTGPGKATLTRLR